LHRGSWGPCPQPSGRCWCEISGIVRLRTNFSRQQRQAGGAPIQVIVDGVDANTARLVEGYVEGAWGIWLAAQAAGRGETLQMPVDLQPRIWFNSELRSRNYLVPGLVAIIMTLIGALLTALVMAREWERGTMEALMVTPASMSEVLIGKLIAYFALGTGGMLLSVGMAVWLFEVPLRGSFWLLWACSSLFLLAALGMGLMISTLARSQFVAGQIAIIATFLPAFLPSGFMFDIDSMPAVVQVITHVVVALFRRHRADPLPCWQRMVGDPAQRAGARRHGGALPRYHLAQVEKAAGVMLHRILALVRKEFLALLKDPKSRLVLIVPPLIQLLVFGYAATFDLTQVPYAVVQRGSRRRFAGSARRLRRLRQLSPGCGNPLRRRDRAAGGCAPGVAGHPCGATLHSRPGGGAAGSVAGHHRWPQLQHGHGRAQLHAQYRQSLQRRLERCQRPARPAGPARNPRLVQSESESRWFFIPGIIGMLTLVVTMLVTALTVAREREQGTFDQLLVTPLRPGEILIGKMLPGFVIGICPGHADPARGHSGSRCHSAACRLSIAAWPCSCCPVSAPACSSRAFRHAATGPAGCLPVHGAGRHSVASPRPSPTCRGLCRSLPTSTPCATF
jgi:ABC-type multidrug transport system permease subunit